MESGVNKLSPKKLLNSKWTAVHPANKEKHFVVTDVKYDDEDNVVFCELEAVMSKNSYQIQWRELQDAANWLQGWV